MATSRTNEVLQHLRRAVRLQEGAGKPDRQLLEEYLSRRDEAALTALVRRHGSMVWGVCRRILRDYHDAEDAFQATFLVFVRKATSIGSRDLLANWLHAVACNTARRARALAARRGARERQVAAMPEPEARPPAIWQELQPVLDQELSRLPPKYRIVVLLCDLQGKSRKEAALELGCPEGTVAGRLARARALLARRLARHGLPCSAGSLAAVLAQDELAASVPPAVVSSTIQAASLVAAGQAAGGVSVPVAALTEGVLKSMFLTKLKTASVVLLLVCLMTGAAGWACQVLAGPQANPGQEEARSAPRAKRIQELEKELSRLQDELARLRRELAVAKNERNVPAREAELVNREDAQLSIKVYPVMGLTSPHVEGMEAQSLLRVITNTVAPVSWNQMGGPGSVEYFPEGGSLVIRQTEDVHRQVQDLLESLRKAKKEQEKAAADRGLGQ
jgi:RNA polymerase sigma factor (sigma-70 family)